MSDDVLGRLKGLCGDLQAKIEASADYRSLKAVERALADISALSSPAVMTPVAAIATEAVVETTAGEADASTEVADETSAVVAPAEAAPDVTADAGVETAAEAALDGAEDDAAGGSSETEAPEAAAEVAADSEAEASGEPGAEAVAAEPEPDAAPAADVVIAEIPAEDRALVAELVAASSEGLVAPNGTTTP